MTATLLIQGLAERLAARARYGFAGEKPIAVWAMALVSGEMRFVLSGQQLLRTHHDSIRRRFESLAKRYGRFKDSGSSWSVITGSQAELQRALRDAPEADHAFCDLSPEDAAALDAWFRARLTKRSSAESPDTGVPSPAQRASVGSASPREKWCVAPMQDGSGVEAWATFRLPFEPKGEKLAYRTELKSALTMLRQRATGFVDAVYVSTALPPGCDVENVLYYNVGEGAFQGLASGGVSFAYRPASPPPTPDGAQFEHYVQYQLSAPESFAAATGQHRVLGELLSVPISELRSGTAAWQVWRDIQRELDRRDLPPSSLSVSSCFGVELSLAGSLSAGCSLTGALKPLFDGVVSGLHAASAVDARVAALAAAKVGQDTESVVRWLTRATPVCVARNCPVEPYQGSVRWHPDDSRLRAGRVVVEPDETKNRALSIRVYAID